MPAASLAADRPAEPNSWTIYITNDNCPDYTWGYTEEQTRKSFANIVRAHLDEMDRTDNEEPHNRNRYNMAVTQEALCFVEYYPQRKAELIRRIKEGRVFVSPYLCNSLWAFQSVEGAIRTFYPARRLERDWGISIDIAEHIEEPSLPWGTASILAGCGIRWLSAPFYSYDSTFSGLKNPPLFFLEGPDGNKIRVVMDTWASNKSSYTQGVHLLRNPDTIVKEWLPHYKSLGGAYPLRAILASGTHGDISPGSGNQARGFADAIAKYNCEPGPRPKLINSALPQFCRAVDDAQAKTPFMPTLRGCFGHSWDLWPVSLAKYAADMRQAERAFLAAEALVSVASLRYPDISKQTQKDREQAEWYWSMLSDHAWNGNSEANKLHNAELRKKWSGQFNRMAQDLLQRGWEAIGLKPDSRTITIFNSLSFPRKALVGIESPLAPGPPNQIGSLSIREKDVPLQLVEEQGKRILYFVCPEVPGFGFEQVTLKPGAQSTLQTDKPAAAGKLSAAPIQLESPYYRLTVDLTTGGISSLVHKATATELVVPDVGRTICQTRYFDGAEHNLTNIKSEVIAAGPVLARLKITGSTQEIQVTNFVTAYAELDQVDFDIHIEKPVTSKQQRLCQVFPVLTKEAELRIETTGAVIRPQHQLPGGAALIAQGGQRPTRDSNWCGAGDLLPGADTRRFAVQGFVDASVPGGIGVTIAPIDAFALRLDLDPITFELLGNDQNYREVTQDQHGVTKFRFRCALRAHAPGYNAQDAFAFSRSAASPLVAAWGAIPENALKAVIELDPARVIATSLKPADEESAGGSILRLWEVAGCSEPLSIGLKGYRKAVLTDLLERDISDLKIVGDRVTIDPNAQGFSSLRLLP
jgi:hypothetical protein